MSQKGLTGGWSKYGGARQHVIKSNITKDWVCQSCGKQRPKEMSPLLWKFLDGDYIRVCATCFHDGCTVLVTRRVKIEARGWY